MIFLEEPGSKARRFESEESIDLDYGEDSDNGEVRTLFYFTFPLLILKIL